MTGPGTQLQPPRGLVAELLTPFTARGEVDLPSLENLLKLITPRAEALLLAGPVCGGREKLDPAQRVALTRFCARITPLPLLVFVTGADGDQSLACARELGRLQEADRIFPVSAPLMLRSNRGLPDWVIRLGRSAGRPVLLYNDPDLIAQTGGPAKRTNIRTSVLKKCLESPLAPAGIIFRGSSDRKANFQDAAEAVKGRSGFVTYEADEIRFVDRPSSAGVVSAGANLLPRAWHLVTRAALFADPAAGSAELLAAAEAVKTLAALGPADLRARLTASLIKNGIFSSRVDPSPESSPPGGLTGLWEKINPSRWQ